LLIFTLILIAAVIFQYYYITSIKSEKKYKKELSEFRIRIVIWPAVCALAFVTAPFEFITTAAFYIGWGSVVLYLFSPTIITRKLKKETEYRSKYSVHS
jgi:O-antigen/teichoic acid export membrane protein